MAITVNSTVRSVFGNRRVLMANLDIGADADTYDTGLTSIDYWSLMADDETAVGGTASDGTLTFQTGGAVTDCKLIAIGI